MILCKFIHNVFFVSLVIDFKSTVQRRVFIRGVVNSIHLTRTVYLLAVRWKSGQAKFAFLRSLAGAELVHLCRMYPTWY